LQQHKGVTWRGRLPVHAWLWRGHAIRPAANASATGLQDECAADPAA